MLLLRLPEDKDTAMKWRVLTSKIARFSSLIKKRTLNNVRF